MTKDKFKVLIKQCVTEVINEELDIPSNDGSSDGADPDDKEKAKNATKDGQSVKFVKPGELEGKEKKKDDKDDDKDDKKKDDKKSDKKDDKKSEKKDDSDEEEVDEEAVPNEKIGQLIQSVKGLFGEIEALQDYANTSGNKKMSSIFAKLGKNFESSIALVDQLKGLREEHIAEEAEHSSEFGDKVIKCLSKYFKDEKQGAKLKEKYMPYIQAGYKHGKKPQEIAERIHTHRFEM